MNGKEEFAVDYDYLVIAMGARPNTFNTPGVVEHCNFLKVTSLELTDMLPLSFSIFINSPLHTHLI
jgi:NADH dehydrogenase FAD-containing subunit